MKAARDRAIDIAHEAAGGPCVFSRALYMQLIEDSGEVGKGARKLVACIERGIVADRREALAAGLPS